MLTGKSGQLVSWALEGREQTLQVLLCLWGELWGNGDYGMLLRGTPQWLGTQVTKHAVLNNSSSLNASQLISEMGLAGTITCTLRML